MSPPPSLQSSLWTSFTLHYFIFTLFGISCISCFLNPDLFYECPWILCIGYFLHINYHISHVWPKGLAESRDNRCFAMCFSVSFTKDWTSRNIVLRVFGTTFKKESQKPCDRSLRTKLRKTCLQSLVWSFTILIILWCVKFQMPGSLIQSGGQQNWISKIKMKPEDKAGAPDGNSQASTESFSRTSFTEDCSNSGCNYLLHLLPMAKD